MAKVCNICSHVCVHPYSGSCLHCPHGSGFKGEVALIKSLIIYLFPLSTQVGIRSIYIYLNRLYLYVYVEG